MVGYNIRKFIKNMPRKNVTCDRCKKTIGDDKLAWFSDANKNWDFCSENCCLKWNEKRNWKDMSKNFIEELRKEWKKWESIHPNFTFELIGKWKCKGFSYEQCKKWIELGLKIDDYAFVAYLKDKDCDPQQENLNLDEWRIKWDEISKKSQAWLDQKYPKKDRNWIETIYLTEPTLVGELDLSDFTYYYRLSFINEIGVRIFISSQVDENKPKHVRIIKLVQAQKWLDENYPQDGTCIRKNELSGSGVNNIDNFGKRREEITKLYISNGKQMDGSLNLNGFVNLRELHCNNNKLTSLDLTNCEKLEVIDCCWSYQLTNLSLPKYCPNLTKLNLYANQLTDLNFLSVINPEKLKELGILSNNFSESDLSIY